LFGSGCSRKKQVTGFRIAVIPKGTTHEFWQAVHAGAMKAKKELNEAGMDVDIVWKGPLREDDRDLQIQLVETFATTGIHGIVLAPLDDTALVPPVEMAMNEGIPVVVIDSGINTENYVSFVATDNYKGGQIAGAHLAKLLQGKGNVALFRYQEGSASTTKREQGFLDEIAKVPGITVVASKDFGGATVDICYQKAENMLGRADLDGLNGVFCPNETTTIAMTKALKERGRAGGQVKVIGFDTGRQSVLDMENGDLQGLIVQNPLDMGYQGVLGVIAKLGGKEFPRRLDTGVGLITKENMNDPTPSKLLNPPIDEYLGEEDES
ncbi:MAG: ABC transporter substrate-binding protein, partial [Verrucomicrobiales bacterium]